MSQFTKETSSGRGMLRKESSVAWRLSIGVAALLRCFLIKNNNAVLA